jgi:uncharacterized hydrophobic protein (TIGR00341 family)
VTLRLLEILTPARDREAVLRLLDEADVVDHWSRPLDGDRFLARALLSADRAEALTDAFRERFLAHEGFRMILLPVEATIPRVPEPQEEDPPEKDGPGKKAPSPPGRLSREELYADVLQGATVNRVYVVTVILASVLAAVGLVRNDPVILVGAMVVAPLLGPNLALAFGTTLGDLPLVARSLRTSLLGVVLALAFSFAIGALMGVDPSVEAIADRTRASVPDVAVALAAGSAGALTFTSGLPAALVGVMVAVALLPPLVNAGLLLGSGYVPGALGALLLVLTNVVCLNLAGVVTFRMQRIRPRSWWEEDRARKSTRLAFWFLALLLAGLIGLMLLLWGA